MKILLVSDTHGRNLNFEEVLEIEKRIKSQRNCFASDEGKIKRSIIRITI